MRRIFSLAAVVMLALAGLALAQSPADPNEGTQLALDPLTGVYNYSWWGVAGRTYFLQQSGDLLNWTYLQDIESGADQPIQVSILSAAPRLFLRLRYTDVPTSDPYNDDFDGDGVSNWQELLQGTDPLVATLDSNGLPLDWEQFYGIPYGTDPNAPAPRGDGLTYRQAFQQGINPLDFYNGSQPVVTLVGGDKQLGLPNATLAKPLAVRVTRADGTAWANALVAFASVGGGGTVLASGAAAGPAFVRTDANGLASVLFQLPNVLGAVCTASAQAVTTASAAPTAVFTARAVADPSAPVTPSDVEAWTEQPSGNVVVT